jgi:hypothetical protein
VLGLASVASVVVRFRRARGEERQQLKWFTYGAGVLTLLLAVSAVSPALNARIPFLVIAAALAAPPLAIGVAVLRYRLYDIDRLINRTLVYGCSPRRWGLPMPALSWSSGSYSVRREAIRQAGRWPAPP